MNRGIRTTAELAALSAMLMAGGCAMFRQKVAEGDVNALPALDARYGAQDLRKLSESIAAKIAGEPQFAEQPGSLVMIIYGIQNRTTTFVDTQAMADRMRILLREKSGSKFQFVNESRRQELLKEQGYQAQQATDESRVAIGRQLGARYMLTGSLVEMQKRTGRQVRVSKTELMYYQLTVEITDLETGIIVWDTQEEFARTAREPLIGW